MNTEQKRKELEDNGYSFGKFDFLELTVITPDGWQWGGRPDEAINKAWQHYQKARLLEDYKKKYPPVVQTRITLA